MKKRLINIKRIILSSVFLLLIGGIIFNSTFFLHVHRTACGKVIVHAHPFNKGAEKQNPLSQHKHNKIELIQYSSIDYYIFTQNRINLKSYSDIELEILCKPSSYANSNIYFLHTTRGPPVVLA